ncbi:MAG: efflux RND transporter periplasmic adaptor subunit [Alistipes sp.]|nr:efflux RND transporter periplasmic adaptor subunit [Alistipes sp.]
MVDYIERDFAGMATADDAVNLAFKISGQIMSVDVSKGDYVRKGELLARLDPRDVELQKAADRSQFERAKSQYERMQRLLDHEAVSQQEYESARAQYVQAQSAYENSKDLLSETNLRAPFGGVIERTYVDTYQRVQSGQTILRLVNPMSTTVEFTMPEKSLPLLFDSTIRFSVIFDNIPNRQFVARLDTYAKTSSDASGFPVSLKIERDEAERYRISPGMTCQVMMHTQGKGARQSTLVVPLSAIYAPASGGEYVWRVTSDGRVKLSPVTLGEVYGRDMVSITSGLAAGAEIVTAGVYKLRDGDIVKPINR